MDHPFKKLLKRKVNHDPRSFNFAFNTSDIQIVDTVHQRLIPILNQGNIGSCTGNAGIGCINTSPFKLNTKVYSPDEAGALALYRDAEIIDGGVGYPPEDMGSSGLSVAKALKKAGLISSYQHTFTLNDALKALVQYPIMTGINWYYGMYTPDLDGRVRPIGNLEGEHEIEAYRIDVKNGRIYFHNSWGTSWGLGGDFYLTWLDYAKLLAEQGDVTVLIPPTNMQTVTLKRNSDNGVETLGTLSVGSFSCNTLERPNKGNARNISCIPSGTYQCTWQFMTDKNEWHYELQAVHGRSGIFIHAGNYYTDSEGCILLGNSLGDINGDGQQDVLNSRITLGKFEALMGQLPFILIIQ